MGKRTRSLGLRKIDRPVGKGRICPQRKPLIISSPAYDFGGIAVILTSTASCRPKSAPAVRLFPNLLNILTDQLESQGGIRELESPLPALSCPGFQSYSGCSFDIGRITEGSYQAPYTRILSPIFSRWSPKGKFCLKVSAPEERRSS